MSSLSLPLCVAGLATDQSLQTSYASYSHYVPPHTSSLLMSPSAPAFSHYGANSAVTTSQIDPPPPAVSPVSAYSRDSVAVASRRPSEEPQSAQPTRHLGPQSRIVDRPQSSSSTLHSTPGEVAWPMNPLGIHSSHDPYHSAFPTMTRSPCLSDSLLELPSNHHASPRPRRMYTPIAPQPIEAPRSHAVKRSRDEEEDIPDESKRRKRSDSNTSTQLDLSEEDKLLLQLKEEDSMPWKDIAARFQSDLGKTYQIPALQMRLKRLRERMRVWTETDVRALRMAHEYWAQNKFDIISQKVGQAPWHKSSIVRKANPDCRCSNLAPKKSGQRGSAHASGRKSTQRRYRTRSTSSICSTASPLIR